MDSNLPDYQAKIGPQPGPQTDFCACEADLCIFGGSAFGGKSYAVLLDPLRAVSNPRFNGVIFRRESPQITAGGGLWDTSLQLYSKCGAEPKENKLMWIWDTGAYIKMTHLQLEKDKMKHQGAQYVYIAFDELTHFTETQFWYLWTRNRPSAGYRGKCWTRATCNPDADSWVRELIDWWIGEDGYPIPERSGVLRYFTREDAKILWVDSDWRDIDGNPPKSLTFIRSTIDDNPAGLEADPTYRTNLLAQDRVTRERLLAGNWNISYRGGMFDPTWFVIEDAAPAGMSRMRYWDLAGTEKKKEDHEPDWTAGALGGIDEYGELWIEDIQHFQQTPGQAEKRIRHNAEIDGNEVAIGIEEEKGASGKYVSSTFQRTVLRGFEVHPDPVSGDKVSRAKPWCALAERGHVHLVRGDWNRTFLAEAGSFPLAKKDQIDAVSGLYKMMATTKKVFFPYSPWAGRHGHRKNFKKERNDFDAAPQEELLVMVSVVREKDTGLSAGCYCWSRKSRKLRIYGEVTHSNPIISSFVADLKEAAVIPLKSEGAIYVNRVYINEESAKGGMDTRKVLKKAGIKSRPNPQHDVAGAVIEANRLFSEERIIVHPDCVEHDIQMRTWKIENGKPDTSTGYALCYCLCLIVSELKAMKELTPPEELKPYGKKKQELRKKLYETGPTAVIGGKKGDEWLAT